MYYLEIVEDGQPIPTGLREGYKTLEDAIEAAKKKADDALPRNIVRVLSLEGYAYLAGDGGEEYKPCKQGE